MGLVKNVKDFYANSQTLEIPHEAEPQRGRYINVDIDIDVESNEDNVMTELGMLFIKACKEKKRL